LGPISPPPKNHGKLECPKKTAIAAKMRRVSNKRLRLKKNSRIENLGQE
jgi:hypothetical protein